MQREPSLSSHSSFLLSSSSSSLSYLSFLSTFLSVFPPHVHLLYILSPPSCHWTARRRGTALPANQRRPTHSWMFATLISERLFSGECVAGAAVYQLVSAGVTHESSSIPRPITQIFSNSSWLLSAAPFFYFFIFFL